MQQSGSNISMMFYLSPGSIKSQGLSPISRTRSDKLGEECNVVWLQIKVDKSGNNFFPFIPLVKFILVTDKFDLNMLPSVLINNMYKKNWYTTTCSIERQQHWGEAMLRCSSYERQQCWGVTVLKGSSVERQQHWEGAMLRCSSYERQQCWGATVLKGSSVERQQHWEAAVFRCSVERQPDATPFAVMQDDCLL